MPLIRFLDNERRMLLPVIFNCPVCGQTIESAADPSQGETQRYVEDCQVCCRPLILEVRISDGSACVSVSPETE